MGLLVLGLDASPVATRAAGGNETNLLTRGVVTGHGGRVADVLMVTTTVGVLHRVHGHTTHLGPLVPLHLVLVVSNTSLQDGLVHAAAAGNKAHHRAATAGMASAHTEHKRQRDCSECETLVGNKQTHVEAMVFFMPEGMRILVVPVSSLWPMTVT